jgi:uncharacterized delta-60 repeat protein
VSSRHSHRIDPLEPRRLLAAGELDAAFGVAGKVTSDLDPFSEQLTAVAVAPDGKVVAGGLLGGRSLVARYASDGSLDTTFNGTGWATSGDVINYPVRALAVQPDEKILAAGAASRGSGVPGSDALLMRFTAGGSLDTTFSDDGVVRLSTPELHHEVRALAVQDDGRMVFVVETDSGGIMVGRLLASGAADSSWGPGGLRTYATGIASPVVDDLLLDDNGRAIVASRVGTSNHVALLRLLPTSGDIDPTFGTAGVLTVQTPATGSLSSSRLIRCPTGWAVAAIRSGTAGAGVVVKHTPDFALDTSFNGTGSASLPAPADATFATMLGDFTGGFVFVARTAPLSASDVALLRLRPDGLPDSAFGTVITDLGANDVPNAVALDARGRIVLAGRKLYPNDQSDVALARYHGPWAPKVLFVRGADRSGGFLEAGDDASRTEHLADVHNRSTAPGNHGWYELAEALRAAGFVVEQRAERVEDAAPPTGQTQGRAVRFENMDLSPYEAVVFGSNNAAYDAFSVDAIEAYVRGGGAALFISDANFGSDWADAPESDQAILSRFGVTVAQDFGVYASERAAGDFLAPAHPVLASVNAFDGEGVSPFFVSNSNVPGVNVTLLARAEQGFRVNAPPYEDPATRRGPVRAVTAGDASLLVGTAALGRFAGLFDRNTFFNLNGAGTSINRFDNPQLALNLFRWLALGDPESTPPVVTQSEFRFERAPQSVAFHLSEDVSRTLDLSDVTVRNLATQQTVAPGAVAQLGDGWVVFAFDAPLPDGDYRATLDAGAVADAHGNALASGASFDFFFLQGDANRDRRVNLADFNILAANFGQSNRTFSQADFSYDGVVNLNDFNILAARFGVALSPSPGDDNDDDDDNQAELADDEIL